MIQRLKLFAPLLIFLVLAGFFAWGLYQNPHQLPSSMLGKQVPAFTAPSLTESSARLSNTIFKGRYTLLNVFASWCAACRMEHPILMDIAASHRIVLLGLSYKDNASTVLDWLQAYGNPYRAIINDANGDIAINLGVFGTPESFLVDPSGRIVYKQSGPLTQKEWQQTWLPLVIHAKEKA